jgi:hypothetical protein
VYLMRAEAKLRKNNDVAGALADVNAIRAARTATKPAPALTSMSLDLLYRERGFELYWEMHRRTDMIRFGKYEDTWTEKTDTDKRKRLFPIPQTAIESGVLIFFAIQAPRREGLRIFAPLRLYGNTDILKMSKIYKADFSF